MIEGTNTEQFRISISPMSKAHARYTVGNAAAHARYIIRGGDGMPMGQLSAGYELPTEGDIFATKDIAQKIVAAWLNSEEKAERKNGKMFDRIQLSFHRKITDVAIREWMVREFAQRVGENKVSWIAQMHTHDENNQHAHMLLRNRDREKGAKGGAPIKWMQKLGAYEIMRATWADIVNAGLEKSGHYETVNHRSYYRQGQMQSLDPKTGEKLPDPKRTPIEERHGSYLLRSVVREQRADGYTGPVDRPNTDEKRAANKRRSAERSKRGTRNAVPPAPVQPQAAPPVVAIKSPAQVPTTPAPVAQPQAAATEPIRMSPSAIWKLIRKRR